MNKSKELITLLLTIPLLVAGCSPASPAALTDDEVLGLTTGLLTALNDDDYGAFITDFSEDMLAAFPESEFQNLRSLLQNNSGKFIATGKLDLSNNQGYAVYRIRCTFELEDVMVTIVFKVDGNLVEGLFFDSPNLRG